MVRNSTKLLYLVLTFMLVQSSIMAQGWEKSFGNPKDEFLKDVLVTADGGIITVGHQQDLTSIDVDVHLIKTDADGNEEWSQLLGNGSRSEFGNSIRNTSDGGYIIGGTAVLDDFNYGFLLKTDAFGNEEWLTLSSRDSIFGNRAIELVNGGYALVGTETVPTSIPQPDVPNNEMMLMKVDENGVEEWIQNYGGSEYEEGYAVVESNGGFLLSGVTTTYGYGLYDIYLVRATADGSYLWQATHGTIHAELGFDMATCDDGNFVITGQSEEFTPESENAFLLKINPAGQEIWWQTYQKVGLESAKSVKQTSDGGFVISGNVSSNPSSDRNAFLLKTDAAGQEDWFKQFGGTSGDRANAVAQANNNGYVLAGLTRSFGNGGADGYLIRTDDTGLSNSCIIYGNVHSSLNSNCNSLNVAQNIEGYIVEVVGGNGITYFGTSDEDGNYLVPVAEGDYNVRLINPSPYWEICDDSIDVTLIGTFDTASVNYTLRTDIACPLMEVDMTTLGLRRCFPGSYSIDYRNLGTVVANPGLVDITFDEYLDIDSSSVPWVSQTGNTYTFNVGNIWPFQEGSFDVYFTVDCDSTVLGQTHCSEAIIHPDSLCLPPDPNWDGSSIEVSAQCIGDSIEFLISNVSGDDMDDVLGFIIIEDDLIQLQGDFDLDAWQDTLIMVPSNGGGTFRLEADQSDGHPGNSRPSVAVEGCGGTPFSTGYVIQYPLNDADLAVDMDCRENTGSYDPNDKHGFPLGYGEEHFIEENTEIEYLIRFQNTGTDTAFTVVIRDTLSSFLAPTSIQPGASSHDYRFELYGTGIVKFTFDEIMLPDSNVNEPGSHGYVKFRIAQRNQNSIGTVIENKAGIYFDYNAPIITNTTLHTIGENYIEINVGPGPVSSTDDLSYVPSVHVSPNPFGERALFELENVEAERFTFNLFDSTGRRVRHEDFDKTNFLFERNRLASGIYFFSITTEEGVIATGRVVLK